MGIESHGNAQIPQPAVTDAPPRAARAATGDCKWTQSEPLTIMGGLTMQIYKRAPLICGILVSSVLCAQNPDPNIGGLKMAQPAAKKPAELRDIPYVSNGHPRQKLDLYLPENSSKMSNHRPLVVWVHGGAWRGGSKEGCKAQPLTHLGYVVASINYRYSNQAVYPAQIEDCKAAIRWLRAHSAEYGIDPNNIGVWGESAGGHLVALLGLTGTIRDFDIGENLDQSSRVECVIDWYGPTDFEHYGGNAWVPDKGADSAVTRLIGGKPSDNPEKARRASPITFVQSNAAPFLIMQGETDPLVPAQQSQLLQTALEKAGVESTLKVIPGAVHGGPQFATPEAIALITNFLERHLLKAQ